MTQQIVSTDPNASFVLSEPVRLAFAKIDANFTEVYANASTPGGTTRQIQYNDAGSFGGIDPSTAGFVLTSNGVFFPPSFAAVVVPSTVPSSHTFTGVVTFSNDIDIAGALIFDNQSTDTLAAGAVNNYTSGSIGIRVIFRLEAGAGGTSLSGIAPSASGKYVMHIFNVSATDALTLVHDAVSTAGNRFLCPNNADYVIRPNGGVTIIYDDTGTARWRVLAA